MAVEVIDKIKPKNGGSFPIADAVDIEVSEGVRLPETLEAKADVSELQLTNATIRTKADTQMVTESISDLQSQIDEIVTPVTQDAEVQNARVGVDGKTYQSLKKRIDSEVNTINNIVSSIKDNTNLVDFEDASYIVGDVVVTTTKKGTISLVGTSTIEGGRLTQIGNTVKLQAGTYYLKGNINQLVIQNKSTQSVITYADTSGRQFTLAEDTEVFFGVSLTLGMEYNKLNIPVILCKNENSEYVPAKAAKDDVARKKLSTVQNVDIPLINQRLDNIGENRIITGWQTGYIITNPSTVETVNINQIINDPAWRTAVIACQENDTFIINGTGSSNPLIWCFIDDAGNILSFPAGSVTTVQNMEITAPYGATKLVINDNSDSNSYKSGYDSSLRRVRERLEVTFATAEEMMSATFLAEGMHCHTLGFYEENDGGAAEYIVVDDESPITIPLRFNLYAKVVGTVTTSKLGIIDTNRIDKLQDALDFTKRLVIDNNIEISSTILVNSNYYLCVDNCIITASGAMTAIYISGSGSTIEGKGRAVIQGTGNRVAYTGILLRPDRNSTTRNTIKYLTISNFIDGIKLYCDQIDDNHIVYFNNLLNLHIVQTRRGISFYGNANANQVRNVLFNDCGAPTIYIDSGAIVIKKIGDQYPVDNSIIQIFHHRSLNCCTLSIEKTKFSYFSSIICEQGGDSAVSVYISDEETSDNFFGMISNVRGGYSYPPACLQYNVVTDIQGKINAPNPLR